MKKRRRPAPIQAVRTVREDDNVRVIEGLGIPFGGPFAGRDSYGTFASSRTDFHWDLFPDRAPAAARAADDVAGDPLFIRPVTYNHGFDDEIGLSRVGGWSPVRQDEHGVWVQAQLDKRAKWYGRIGELLDRDGLGFSSGSAEHSVRFDDRSGEWLEWPVYELALTPTESNPYAAIAARAATTVGRLGRREARELDITALRYSPSAWDASAAAWTLSSLIDLLGEEADETEQADHLRNAIAELQAFIALELAEVGTTEDADEAAEESTSVVESLTVTAWASGVRAGADTAAAMRLAQEALEAALDHIRASGTAPGDDATRTADAQPALRILAAPVRDDAAAQRVLTDLAEAAARRAAERLTGPAPG